MRLVYILCLFLIWSVILGLAFVELILDTSQAQRNIYERYSRIKICKNYFHYLTEINSKK